MPWDLKETTYWKHLKGNWRVSLRALTFRPPMILMSLLHWLHGLFPHSITSHHYWGLAGKGEIGPKYLIDLLRR